MMGKGTACIPDQNHFTKLNLKSIKSLSKNDLKVLVELRTAHNDSW